MNYSISFTTVMGSSLHSFPLNPHSSTISPLSNPPTSSRLVLLPPVSTALADITGKAVADHLCLGLVKLTVQGVIKACVPYLTEIMESHFVTQNPLFSIKGGSCPKSTNHSTKSDCHESDGSNEEEKAVPSPRQKKPRSWEKTNHLHMSYPTKECFCC